MSSYDAAQLGHISPQLSRLRVAVLKEFKVVRILPIEIKRYRLYANRDG